jgi:TRAP-type C4-dicarboxylate transport system permease small subunit
MDLFIKTVGNISKACGVVAAALVAAAVLVVCEMVVMRYFLRASTIWQTEFVTFSLVGATFIGSPYVLLVKGHVNVDLVAIWLKHRSRRTLAIIAYGISLIFSAIVAWTGFELLHESWTEGWRTDTVWSLPLWIPYLAMPVGIGIMTLQYVADIMAVATGRDAPFGLDSGDEA